MIGLSLCDMITFCQSHGGHELCRKENMMTPEQIKQLRSLCNAAAPGPWILGGGGCVKSTSVTREKTKGLAMVQVALAIEAPIDEETQIESHDARFIAAAREALPRLLDDIATLQNLCGETLMYAQAFADDNISADEDDVARLREIKNGWSP
jgi:hypothetical protein